MIHWLALFAIVLYLAAASTLARPVLNGEQLRNRLALSLASGALLIHTALLIVIHGGVLDLHFFTALSLLAYVIAMLTLLVNLWRPVAALGVIVFSLAAIFISIDGFMCSPPHSPRVGWPIALHATLALIAFGILTITALLAILLVLQHRALRHHQLGKWLCTLPPLTLTETLLFRLLGAGFFFLTLACITGALFISHLFGQHLIHKTVLSIIAWLVFGTLLYGRWRYGWRGRRASHLTVFGMGVLLLAFFGVKTILDLFLPHAG